MVRWRHFPDERHHENVRGRVPEEVSGHAAESTAHVAVGRASAHHQEVGARGGLENDAARVARPEHDVQIGAASSVALPDVASGLASGIPRMTAEREDLLSGWRITGSAARIGGGSPRR